MRRPGLDLEGVCLAVLLLVVGAFLLYLRAEPSTFAIVGVCWLASLALKVVLGDSLRVNNLSLPSTVYLFYIVLLAVPAVFEFLDMSHPVRYKYLIAVQSVLVTLPLGVYAANLFFVGPGARIRAYAQSKLLPTTADLRVGSFLPLLLLAGLAGPVGFVLTAEHVPLMKVLVAQPIDDITLRFEVSRIPRAVLFGFALGRQVILPVCMLYCFFMMRFRPRPWGLRFIALLVLATLVASLGLERGPPLAVYVMLLFGVAVCQDVSPLHPRAFPVYALVAGTGLAVAGFLSAYQYQSSPTTADYVDHVQHVAVNRAFLTADVAARTFERYPNSNTLLHGKYIRMFSLVTGGEYLDSFDYVTDPDMRYSVLPASFVADLYRNWGLTAVFVGSIGLGFMLQCIQLLLFKTKTIVAAVFQVILLMMSVWYIIGNAFGIVTTAALALSTVSGFVAIRLSDRRPLSDRSPAGA